MCVCEQVVATALGVNFRGYQNTIVARTRLNPLVFLWKCAPRCAGGTYLVERDRKDIDYGSLALDVSKTMIVPSDDTQCAVLWSHIYVGGFCPCSVRQMRKHRCL